MSGPESNPPDDRLLEEFLAGEGAVLAAYHDAAQHKAPVHLDAAILHAAHAAARHVPRRRRARWQAPVAAAAVMVLSFGVFLQAQRDPVIQKEVMAVRDRPAAPTAIETGQSVSKAEVLAETTPARLEADTEQKQGLGVAGKPKSALRAERRRAAAADGAPPPAAPPPPPAMAMVDAPVPPAALEASAAERAVVVDDAAGPSAVAGAAASESMPRQDQFAAALDPAPMTQSSRAPLASKLTSHHAPSVVSNTPMATAIEQWAQRCGAESLALSAPMLWRGLALESWTREVDGKRVKTKLVFASDVTREAIAASLGSLAAKASLAALQCTVPVVRELRQSADGWALVCDCPVAE